MRAFLSLATGLWLQVMVSLFTLNAVMAEEVESLQVEVLERHERKHVGFTQGLFILNGKLYESTGLYGESQIRRMDLRTEEMELSKQLPDHIFAEGLAPVGEGQMVQLTWKAKTGIVYDREELNIVKVFKYDTEGWGIASNGAAGEQIVMSDGTATLRFLQPGSYEVTHHITVTRDGQPVDKLNELEWVDGYLYANVWMSNEILKIAPASGKVVATIDCTALRPAGLRNPDAVLNGIAYDPSEQVFYITGKLWPVWYKVRFVPEG